MLPESFITHCTNGTLIMNHFTFKFEFEINYNKLDLVKLFKYLEVIFNKHLNYHDSVNA